MALNSTTLKGIFSKLKPAAKTIANYGDNVASSYSPEMTRLLQAVQDYDSAVAHGAIPSKLDNILHPPSKRHVDPMSAVASDIRDASLNPLWDASEIDLSKLTHNVDDIVDTPYSYGNIQRGVVLTGDGTGRYGYSPDWHNASNDDLVRKSTHTWKMRKDGDYEFPVPIADDSFLQLDTGVRQSGLPGTAAEQSELIDALSNSDTMNDIDTALQFGKPIANFNNTSKYIDQLVSPTPNWSSRWGGLERQDLRLQNLYNQLRENFDRWTNFESSFGFTPSHVNTDDLADQIIKLEHLKHSKRW